MLTIKLISGKVLSQSVKIEKRNNFIVISQKFTSADEWDNEVFAKTFNGKALWF